MAISNITIAANPSKIIQVNSGGTDVDFVALPSGGDTYNYRTGPSVPDWTQATLIKDSAEHDLDLSAIIPAGTKSVLLNLLVNNTAAGQAFYFKKKNDTYYLSGIYGYSGGAGVSTAQHIWITPDANRLITYVFNNTTWTTIKITVCAWIV